MVRRFAFPYNETSPAACGELFLYLAVASDILGKFAPPKINASLWHAGSVASGMSVPKAAVYEYYLSVFSEYYVWFTRHVGSV